MSSDNSKRRWGWLAVIITRCCLLYVGWLAVIAFRPAVAGAGPRRLGWIGDPGSVGSMTLGLVLAAGRDADPFPALGLVRRLGPHAGRLGLQMARLLAISATVSDVTSVLFAVSGSQLDRFGLGPNQTVP